ncbi:MAG: hypothetical protein JXM70_00510 [Pirellulales bacterium]|nr:hypothetical protein [Pirellulales bacterium]
MDSWCERRELRCLSLLLPAYVSPLAHTDQLHGLLDVLKDVNGLCREKLKSDELNWLIEAHNTLEDISAEVWKPK